MTVATIGMSPNGKTSGSIKPHQASGDRQSEVASLDRWIVDGGANASNATSTKLAVIKPNIANIIEILEITPS